MPIYLFYLFCLISSLPFFLLLDLYRNPQNRHLHFHIYLIILLVSSLFLHLPSGLHLTIHLEELTTLLKDDPVTRQLHRRNLKVSWDFVLTFGA